MKKIQGSGQALEEAMEHGDESNFSSNGGIWNNAKKIERVYRKKWN